MLLTGRFWGVLIAFVATACVKTDQSTTKPRDCGLRPTPVVVADGLSVDLPPGASKEMIQEVFVGGFIKPTPLGCDGELGSLLFLSFPGEGITWDAFPGVNPESTMLELSKETVYLALLHGIETEIEVIAGSEAERDLTTSATVAGEWYLARVIHVDGKVIAVGYRAQGEKAWRSLAPLFERSAKSMKWTPSSTSSRAARSAR